MEYPMYLISLIAGGILSLVCIGVAYWVGYLKGSTQKNGLLFERLSESGGKVIRLYRLLRKCRVNLVNELQHNDLLRESNKTKYLEGFKDGSAAAPDCSNTFVTTGGYFTKERK